MKPSDWKAIAEGVGVTAIVASLIFVGLQLKQEQEIAQAQAIGDMIQYRIEAQVELNAHTGILVKANSNAVLDVVEMQILRNLVQMEEDRTFLQTLRQGPLGDNIQTHELKFAVFLFKNPAARRAWMELDEEMMMLIDPLRTAESRAETRASGSYAFRQRIKGSLAKLDELARE